MKRHKRRLHRWRYLRQGVDEKGSEVCCGDRLDNQKRQHIVRTIGPRTWCFHRVQVLIAVRREGLSDERSIHAA